MSDINIRIKDDWVIYVGVGVVVACIWLFALWQSEVAEVRRMVGVVRQYETERQLIDSVVTTFRCQRDHICKRPHLIGIEYKDVGPDTFPERWENKRTKKKASKQ